MKFLILFLISLGVFAQDEKETQEEVKPVGPCDYTYEIANLIFKERWNDLVQFIKFPMSRDYPLKSLTKEAFLESPSLLFEKDMFKEGVKIKEGSQACMLNNGLIWASKDDDKKIIRVNFETQISREQRIKATKKQLNLLPSDKNISKVMLSCVFNKNDYHVYKNIKTGKYRLLVVDGPKIITEIKGGTFRQDETGIRYFRFDQEGTRLTLADNIREAGYYLNLQPQGKKESFFKCLEPNT
jgi:hypothetical protein